MQLVPAPKWAGLVKIRKSDSIAAMQPKPNPAKHRPLFLLVALACVGLAAAFFHKQARRLEIEGARPQAVELREVRAARLTNDLAAPIAVQGLSLRVDAQSDSEPTSLAALALGQKNERQDSTIIETIPATLLERARRDMTLSELTNAAPARPTGEKIVIE
jgi:hypothetical protein